MVRPPTGTGSQALPDTLNGFAQLVTQDPDECQFVVWLNPYWGPVESEGKTFEQMKVYQANKNRVSAIIHIPALKDRKQDIPKLAQHFLQQAAKELNVEAKILTKEAEQFLTQLEWPGNVRQLENVCHWLTVMAPSQVVDLKDLPPEVLAMAGAAPADSPPAAIAAAPELVGSAWTPPPQPVPVPAVPMVTPAPAMAAASPVVVAPLISIDHTPGAFKRNVPSPATMAMPGG